MPKVDRRAPAYLAFVREQPCCWCGHRAPSDPHHFGPRGIGRKADDLHTVPLCRACHDHFHDHRAFPGATTEATALRIWRVQAELMVKWQRLEPAIVVAYSVRQLSDEKCGCAAKAAALSYQEGAHVDGDQGWIDWGRRLQDRLLTDGLAIVEVSDV